MMQENLVTFIENSIRNNWEIAAMSDYNGESVKYSQVAETIARLHLILEASNVHEGDKVALLGKNSINWGMAYLAIVSYGAVVVPILPDFKANDIHHIINHSDSVVLFAGDHLFESLEPDHMKGIRLTVSLKDFRFLNQPADKKIDKALKGVPAKWKERYPEGLTRDLLNLKKIANEKLAVISYTSGTTGFTKGVMIPHNSLVANVVYANNNMPLKSGDSIVSFLPLAHAYGCAFEFLWPFTLGCHITFLTKTPSPQIILQAFRQIKPRLILAVPLIMEKIYKKQILPALNKTTMKMLLKVPGLNSIVHKKVRNKLIDVFGGNFHEVVIGGAALNQEVELFLNKIGFPYSIGYGMTECGPLISYANYDKTRLGASGKVVDTLEVMIDSSDPYNIVGEIMVRGENVMMGYYKNSEASRQVLDDQGWLHTGDLGLIDQDQYIYIKGRSKSMFLGPSGQNIYPEEMEARFNNLPFVQECLVVEKEGRITCLMYPDYELVDQKKISEAELLELFESYRKQINQDLPAYAQIGTVKIFPEEFEKTPKKNIRRFLYTAEG
ncbi:MAG: AMP-binding protein [Bacteroidales bacterium]